MTATSDVAIIGGGVIGLTLAWRLAQGGARVTVLDAGRTRLPGQASWAAAGMLAPLAESRQQTPFVDLGLDSLRRYPSFVEELQAETGISTGIAGPGMLRVAQTETQEEQLCAAYSWQKRLGMALEWLPEKEARKREPSLSMETRAAVYSPRERHIVPRTLLLALRAACRSRDVRVLRGAHVVGLNTHGARITSVSLGMRFVAFGTLVVAGGAWTGELGRALGLTLPITPVRGQAIALAADQVFSLSHTIYGAEGYVVPRQSGQIVIGATEENVGFAAGTTREGQTWLREMGARLAPSLAGLKRTEGWAGLRPVMADGLPAIGAAPGWDNVYFAAGHGRNGILLAPATADLMADCLLNNTPPPAAFSPARFGGRM